MFEKEVEKYLKSRTGKYGFFFEDLYSGYSYGYNENVKLISAGCMKLPIAVALMKCEEEGNIDYWYIRYVDRITSDEERKKALTAIYGEFAKLKLGGKI